LHRPIFVTSVHLTKIVNHEQNYITWTTLKHSTSHEVLVSEKYCLHHLGLMINARWLPDFKTCSPVSDGSGQQLLCMLRGHSWQASDHNDERGVLNC